jgi:hypothetical protein
MFDFNGVTQKEWLATWHECYRVLQCFPVPLGIVLLEKKWKSDRYVQTADIVQNKGKEDEYLGICNDLITGEKGGTYRLYKNISQYQYPKQEERAILWADTKKAKGYMGGVLNIDRIEGDPRCIWANETHGAPYTLAVLALGILLENRFPDKCFLHGEYTNEQVERMCAWLSGVVQTKIALPVCNDPEQLLERLSGIYTKPHLIVRRFWVLNLIGLREGFQSLIEHGYDKAIQSEIIRRTKSFSSVSQIGVTDLLLPYLEATQDIEHVIELVQKMHEINGQEDFSLTCLLTTLVSEGITINPYENEIVKEWDKFGKSLTTDMENMNMLMLRMAGLPTRMDFFITADKLLEIFGCTEPANGVEFQNIIEKWTAKTRSDYQKLADVTEKLIEKVPQPKYNDTSYFETKASQIRRKYLPSEDYILHEVEGQAQTFSDYKRCALIIAELLGKIVCQHREENTFSSCKKALVQLTHHISNEYSLTETAWQTIDNEQDLDILTMLTVFAGVHGQELHTWCKFIMETPELWPEMREVFVSQIQSSE